MTDQELSDEDLKLLADHIEKRLEEERRDYENGDLRALIQAIGLILNDEGSNASGADFPGWVKTALRAMYRKFAMGELESWEDVLGKPFPGNSRTKRVQLFRYLEIRWRVDALRKERKLKKGQRGDKDVFKVVADQFNSEGRGIGDSSTVRDIYYSISKAKKPKI
jgi:hypothetical protein